ncbi:hypothetical protein GTY82_16050 [Streptomyces sp. SID5476]|uniref:Uncharacterized protein n=1 Tax=Streptomyces bottropensis ATCC 25435 TaxID=1054862 RepID=M3FYR6_9ACTN|nr:hypothetical protein SBD_0897 [Streptomyces bottropensis ATCC 25435]MZD18705.1 hypothetical protein [Streptomyces sp. SID5476]
MWRGATTVPDHGGAGAAREKTLTTRQGRSDRTADLPHGVDGGAGDTATAAVSQARVVALERHVAVEGREP